MKLIDLFNIRLNNQLLSDSKFDRPDQVVSTLGAVQAQDYYGSLWAIGLRSKNLTETDVEKTIAERTIVRTWPMRGTLHFVSAYDVRWMLKLLTPRIISGSNGRNKQLGLDDKVFNRSRDLFIKNLEGRNQLTRDEMYNLLESNNISAAGQRGIHILGRLAMEGILCFGIRKGRQQTFVLLDEWVPDSKNLTREESLAKLTLRYFKNHGPATLKDFTWWSGLTVNDAKNGLEMIESHLEQEIYNGRTFLFSPQKNYIKNSSLNTILLPAFDEYLVGYKERTDVLDMLYKNRINSIGLLSPTIIIDGKVIGTWRRSIKNEKVIIELYPFTALSKTNYENVLSAAKRYGRFINKKVFIKLKK